MIFELIWTLILPYFEPTLYHLKLTPLLLETRSFTVPLNNARFLRREVTGDAGQVTLQVFEFVALGFDCRTRLLGFVVLVEDDAEQAAQNGGHEEQQRHDHVEGDAHVDGGREVEDVGLVVGVVVVAGVLGLVELLQLFDLLQELHSLDGHRWEMGQFLLFGKFV